MAGTGSSGNEITIVPLLKPFAIFFFGAILAYGHHALNHFIDKHPPDFIPALSQVWTIRIGTAFALSFQVALSIALSFVLCQIMWWTLRTKELTVPEIDKVYHSTVGRDIVTTVFSSTLLKSPLLVLGVFVSFLLSIPTVLTPSSLRVTPQTSGNVTTTCQIPTGNLVNGGPDSTLYVTSGSGIWTGITFVAQKLAASTLVGQEIPLIPQPSVCGSYCTYSVTLPSIAYRCEEINDTALPPEMHDIPPAGWAAQETFWNATTTLDTNSHPEAEFYVYWKSTTNPAMSGSARCMVATAAYDFTISSINGTQFVDKKVTYTGSLGNAADSSSLSKLSIEDQKSLLQLTSLASATRSLLLGGIYVLHGTNDSDSNRPVFTSSAVSGAFLNASRIGPDFTWNDVPGGIEELSHNVSAAILTLDLGLKQDKCTASRQVIVYEYDWMSLWVPYGVALLIVLLFLVMGVSIFAGYNSENLEPLFSDMIALAPDEMNGNSTRGSKWYLEGKKFKQRSSGAQTS